MAYDPRGDHGAPGGGYESGGFARARGRREYFTILLFYYLAIHSWILYTSYIYKPLLVSWKNCDAIGRYFPSSSLYHEYDIYMMPHSHSHFYSP